MKIIRNIFLLVLPFLVMIIVNEMERPAIKGKPYSYYGITTINSVKKNPNKCTWFCHNNTIYCKEHHVKYLKKHIKKTDLIYFIIIKLLKNTGNYALANILFLVILFPFMIWYFIIKSLNMQDEINSLKKKL